MGTNLNAETSMVELGGLNRNIGCVELGSTQPSSVFKGSVFFKGDFY